MHSFFRAFNNARSNHGASERKWDRLQAHKKQRVAADKHPRV